MQSDWTEKNNLIDVSGFDDIKLDLNRKIDGFFSVYSEDEYNLWTGGSAKSNVSMSAFWKDAWGDSWTTEFG